MADGNWLRADGFSNNTFYEYWGDWAHGNPIFYKSDDYNLKFKKTFDELYSNTLKKRDQIIHNNFSLIEIWESDWKEQLKQKIPN